MHNVNEISSVFILSTGAQDQIISYYYYYYNTQRSITELYSCKHGPQVLRRQQEIQQEFQSELSSNHW